MGRVVVVMSVGVGCVSQVVWCWALWSLCPKRGSVGRVAGVPEESVTAFGRACFSASGPALCGVALVGRARAWFGASFADANPEQTKLL